MGEAWLESGAHGHETYAYDYGRSLLPGPDSGAGMWRYQGLLPRPDEPTSYPLPVGGTPLRAPGELRERLGLPGLWLKDETTGPSASNKDRATALVIDQGLRLGVKAVSTASTGNAAVSTAIGGAAAGMAVIIFVPADCAPAKVELMTAMGASVFRVREGYRAAFDLSRRAAAHFSWLDRCTGVSPLTVEAKKTVSFEVWEQLGARMPDVVVLPVGDGTTLIGAAKGFRELVACGVLAKVPRIIAVQAQGCAPLAWQWHGARAPAQWPGTVADGIEVPQPVVGDWAIEEVRLADGNFITVTDAEILDAVNLLSDAAQLASEPAGAAAVAGLRRASAAGLVTPGETVVAWVTGANLPTAPVTVERPGAAFTIKADLDAVAAALSLL
ncbi:pyridoxal-phosphate dependent enzyme [Streptomyces sp. SID13031]|uniref:threonine synthase n=1 Tax=Streptomyces sp. SID13031 TaxID=2706046 RepID=UPI0013CB7338|nr:pyridoxal-phosphate dependent enzyme [Streptomyces sp. SID13031]NEA33612.1 pyridoxal-phosphate dependent enzyme [Streptomyces sp. SID13031]